MPSSYPSGLDALQRVAAGDSMQSTSHSGLHNSQSDAIEAIQAVLGLSPQGGSASVSARCAALESGKASLSGSVSFGGTVGGTGLSGSLLSSASPVMNGTAAAGTATVPSRQDHVHPSDTSRAAASHAASHASAGSDPITLAQSQVTNLTTDLAAKAALAGATFTGDVTVSKAAAALTVSASSGNSSLSLNVVSGSAGAIRFRTGTSQRWVIQKNGLSETGSNAGSNLEVIALDDSGSTLSTPLVITRATGKTTFGSVGASAGIEYGTSGPRDMVGTGSPEGVVTAPVGSTWRDTNATTGAIKWIKASGSGNTGWRVEYGDTGWRNVTASMEAGFKTSNPNAALYVRRTNDRVTWMLNETIAGSATGTVAIYVPPTGFKETVGSIPAGVHCINANTGTGLNETFYFASDTTLYGFAWTAIRHLALLSYPLASSTAWPTSLPGTAA